MREIVEIYEILNRCSLQDATKVEKCGHGGKVLIAHEEVKPRHFNVPSHEVGAVAGFGLRQLDAAFLPDSRNMLQCRILPGNQ